VAAPHIFLHSVLSIALFWECYQQEFSGPPHPPQLPTSNDLLLAQSNKRAAGFSSPKTGEDLHLSPLKQSPQKNIPKPPSPEKNREGLIDFLISAV
jgi:hypothetical protein